MLYGERIVIIFWKLIGGPNSSHPLQFTTDWDSPQQYFLENVSLAIAYFLLIIVLIIH